MKVIRDSGGGRRMPSAPFWGFFFLGQPFDPPPVNYSAGAAVILGSKQDLSDLAAEVRGKRLSRETRPCSLQAGVRKQVRNLKPGDIVGLRFYFQLAAGQGRNELSCLHELGSVLVDLLEGLH